MQSDLDFFSTELDAMCIERDALARCASNAVCRIESSYRPHAPKDAHYSAMYSSQWHVERAVATIDQMNRDIDRLHDRCAALRRKASVE
jgi:hypothetical protein